MSDDEHGFVPAPLRRHFKVYSQNSVGADDAAALAEKEQVRQARTTRSAHVVATLLSQNSPPPSLYSNAIERSITARMTFARALGGLEAYFREVEVKVQQLEAKSDLEWLYDRKLKMPTLVQTQRRIVNVCQGCLSDCDLYLGMYEALPSPPAASLTAVVRFVACSTKSAMLHQTLPIQVQGLEPQTLDNRTITEQALTTGSPVVIDDIAPLVERGQIYRFVASETVTGPFSCFPMVSGADRVGVISVDSCRKAQRLLPQSMSVESLHAFLLRMQLKDAAVEFKRVKMDGARFLVLSEMDLRHKPSFQRLKVSTRNSLIEIVRALQRGSRMHLPDSYEQESQCFTQDPVAIEFLANISKMSGEFLGFYRPFCWVQEIANITRSSTCTAYDVYDVLIQSIAKSLGVLERIAVWKITKIKTTAVTTGPPTSSTTPWEVDVVATTAVPDDRISPFINGEERKMKRVVLFKENEDGGRRGEACAPFMRGGVINVVATKPTGTALPCEEAAYHISWADGSLQSAAWSQLRQLLPIRNMNAKHFQLQHLCQRLDQEDAREAEHARKAIRINRPNAAVLVICDSSRPKSVKYVLEVDFLTAHEPPTHTMSFLERAVQVTERALMCVRERETRHARRKKAIAKNAQKFQSIGLNPSCDALRSLQDIVAKMFDDIAASLPGVHTQIAELQGDGSQLKYTFAGNGSTALNSRLNRGQGVSFKCLETKQPLVVGTTSEFRSRLQRIGDTLRIQQALKDEMFPFIFIPLVHEDCVIGVLSVDNFQKVPKGRDDEVHPEAGVLDFLVSLAKLLASAIYAKRRSYALHEIQIACQEPLRSPQQLLFYACRSLKDVMIGAWKVRVVEVDGVRGKTTLVYDFSEAEREQARSWLFNVVRPMAFRWKELCTDTILDNLRNMQPGDKQVANSVIDLLAAIREDELDNQNAAEKYQQLSAEGESTQANEVRKVAVEAERLKLLEREIANKYFLLREDGQDSSPRRAGEDNRLANNRYVAHAMKLFLGSAANLYSDVPAMTKSSSKAFLTVSVTPQFHAVCDQIYIQRVADITSKYMAKLHDRIRRSRERVHALEVFRTLCQKTLTQDLTELAKTTMTPSKHMLHQLSPVQEQEVESLLKMQYETIVLIEHTLQSPHVYFGLWEPAMRLIRYTSASKTSVMVGKKLKHRAGVSVMAMEKQIPIVVTRQDADVDEPTSTARRLRFFTTESFEERKWPFVVVPLGNLGVLTINNMEKYELESGESQPELGVVDFLRKIGQSFAEVLTVIRERSCQHRQQLREVALVRVITACENFKPSLSPATAKSLYLPHLAIQQIETALNGACAYIGLVEPLCERIRFVVASKQSQMENNVVNTIQSLSFGVFAKQRTVVIPQLTQYFKQQQYEAQHNGTEPKLKHFGSGKSPYGPFVCAPIPFVGVLSVDSFPGAAGGVFSPSFPEDGVVGFIERVANYVGDNLRTIAANEAKKILPTLFQGNQTTFETLFKEILKVISHNLLAVFEAQAFQCQRDDLTGRWQKAVLVSMQRTVEVGKAEDDRNEKGQLLLQSLEERYQQRNQSEDANSIEPKLPSVHQLRGSPETLIVHCTPTRDVESDGAVLKTTTILLLRVKGATWTYDEDFLTSILPEINALIDLVNTRVQGIVTRRAATQQVVKLCSSLDALPSADAVQEMYSTVLPNALEVIAEGMSPSHCDVYLGERELTDRTNSSPCHLQLRYVAASRYSLMKDVTVDLENPSNLSLTVAQSLQNQQLSVVVLTHESFPVRSFTTKPAQRVFIAIPMGDNHVLCADSLGQEAFVPITRVTVESDVLAFLKASASRLQEAILSTRHRASYDQIRQLTSRPHADLRLYYSTILDVLRRDLVHLHSQQIVTLGADFTSAFRLEAWQGASTKRQITTIPEHYCSVNGCQRDLIVHEIHSETNMFLPMTNLPRTLDESRSRMQPAQGVEKHGAFTSGCLTTLLDSSRGGDAKLALCVFSHDAKTNESRGVSRMGRRTRMGRDLGTNPAFFSNYQRQYFFASAAVAADAFVHVFRACVLETFGAELLVLLQEYLDAKNGVVARLSEYQSAGTDFVDTKAVVLFSQQPGKYPPGRTLRGKLERKVQQFQASNAPLSILVTKKAVPTPPVKDATRKSTVVVKPTKRGLFGGRSLFRYGKKKRQEEEEEERAKQQEQLLKSAPALEALSPSRTHQQQQEVTLNVFVRALDYQGRSDVILLTAEKQPVVAATAMENVTRLMKSRADAIAKEFLAQTPKGDEEINATRFCSDGTHSFMYDDLGGGGFLLLSMLKQARENYEQIEGLFGSAMRQLLTGAQSTARGESKSVEFSSLFGKGEESSATTAVMALLRVTMVICGNKREAVIAMDQTTLMKEFLRRQAGRMLIQIDPTDKKHWGALARGRTLLRSFNDVIHTLGPKDEGAGTVTEKSTQALHAVLDLILVQSAVVRYLKHLEAELVRERRQNYEAPAIKLQCFVRQKLAKIELTQRRREFKAALAIQCAYRQHLARRQLLFMTWNRAAVTLQRAYRRRRQRAKGSRPRRLTTELFAASQTHGKSSIAQDSIVEPSVWQMDMAAFGTFDEYLSSKLGREQIKREEELMWRHRKELEKERSKLSREEALREDVGDLFELLDDVGRGELSRERTTGLITRLHVPLSEEEIADVVAMMDSDGSGGISLDEFMRWFTYEFPQLQKRAPKVCGVMTRKDWQWVIQQSARSAILKRWRAMRAGKANTVQLAITEEEEDEEEQE